MAQRRTDRAVSQLRELAREQSSVPLPADAPPFGYELSLDGVDWSRLSPSMRAVVLAFADALREISRERARAAAPGHGRLYPGADC